MKQWITAQGLISLPGYHWVEEEEPDNLSANNYPSRAHYQIFQYFNTSNDNMFIFKLLTISEQVG